MSIEVRKNTIGREPLNIAVDQRFYVHPEDQEDEGTYFRVDGLYRKIVMLHEVKPTGKMAKELVINRRYLEERGTSRRGRLRFVDADEWLEYKVCRILPLVERPTAKSVTRLTLLVYPELSE